MVPSIGADGGHAQGANIAVLRMVASAPPHRSNLESTDLNPDQEEQRGVSREGRAVIAHERLGRFSSSLGASVPILNTGR